MTFYARDRERKRRIIVACAKIFLWALVVGIGMYLLLWLTNPNPHSSPIWTIFGGLVLIIAGFVAVLSACTAIGFFAYWKFKSE